MALAFCTLFALSTFTSRVDAKKSELLITPPIAIETPSPTAVNDQLEIASLRYQIEATKEYTQNIMQAVYAFLAGTFTLLLVFIGANIFVNFRQYERDKKELGKDIDNQLLVAKKEIDNKFQVTNNDLQEKFRFGTENLAKTVVDIAVERTASQIVELKRKVEDQVIFSTGLEAEISVIKGNPEAAILQLIRKIKMNPRHYTLYHSLEEISELIDKVRIPFDSDEFADLQKLLTLITEEHRPYLQKIVDKMSKNLK
jgi:hypothetical protein